jgi:hypothetical protein
MFNFRLPLLAAALFTIAPATQALDGSGPRRWRPSPRVEAWAAPVFVPLDGQAPGSHSGQTVYIDPVTSAIRPGPAAKGGRPDFVQLPPQAQQFRWGRTSDGYLFIDASAQQETLTVTLDADGTAHMNCGDASHGHAPAPAASGERSR